MGMALDESKESDVREDFEGFSVVLDKEFFDQVGGVSIDYRKTPFGEGFDLRTPRAPEGGCEDSGCDSGCC
jgi:Fe-S cluster assembly iron-binding protein IscA